MACVHFPRLRALSPSAFKLYVFFLDRVQKRNNPTVRISLADLGYESGLQAPCPFPALRHGRDGQVRKALRELIDRGLIQKQGQRGKAPNTYQVMNAPEHDLPAAGSKPVLKI